MSDMKSGETRAYRQTARAQAAEETGRRIASAFAKLMHERWFEDVTLEEVAAQAGVTVRTIIRRSGGKEGLLAGYVAHVGPKIVAMRSAAPGDVAGAVKGVVDVYESLGDETIRNLAQEPRFAALSSPLEQGRQGHRGLTEATYAPWLDPLDATERRRALDQLVVATDVYTWKLLRRDMRRSRKETQAAMLELVTAILARSGQSPKRQVEEKT